MWPEVAAEQRVLQWRLGLTLAERVLARKAWPLSVPVVLRRCFVFSLSQYRSGAPCKLHAKASGQDKSRSNEKGWFLQDGPSGMGVTCAPECHARGCDSALPRQRVGGLQEQGNESNATGSLEHLLVCPKVVCAWWRGDRSACGQPVMLGLWYAYRLERRLRGSLLHYLEEEDGGLSAGDWTVLFYSLQCTYMDTVLAARLVCPDWQPSGL